MEGPEVAQEQHCWLGAARRFSLEIDHASGRLGMAMTDKPAVPVARIDIPSTRISRHHGIRAKVILKVAESHCLGSGNRKSMASWKPIKLEDFERLYREQLGELSDDERIVFQKRSVDPWQAITWRSEMYGDEWVYVVWQRKWEGEMWVLYFDDVEWGFCMGTVDDGGRLTSGNCDRFTLKEAVIYRLQPWEKRCESNGETGE